MTVTTMVQAPVGPGSSAGGDAARSREFLNGFLAALGIAAQHLDTDGEIEAQIERWLIDLSIRDFDRLADGVARVAARLCLSPDDGVILLKHGTLEPESLLIGAASDGQGAVPVKLRMVEQLMQRLERRVRPESAKRGGKVSDVWTYDVANWELIAPNGKSVKLSLVESRIVRCLMSRRCDVVAREDLLTALSRPHLAAYRRNLDMTVWRLRKKVEKHCQTPLPVTSARGVGYVFRAPALMLHDALSRMSIPIASPSTEASTQQAVRCSDAGAR